MKESSGQSSGSSDERQLEIALQRLLAVLVDIAETTTTRREETMIPNGDEPAESLTTMVSFVENPSLKGDAKDELLNR